MVNGILLTDVNSIKTVTWRFFSDKFRETCKDRPLFISDKFRQLSSMDRDFLEEPFVMSEIKDVVWCCGSEKAPGSPVASPLNSSGGSGTFCKMILCAL